MTYLRSSRGNRHWGERKTNLRWIALWLTIAFLSVCALTSETAPFPLANGLAWMPSRPISWEDFQAEPPAQAEANSEAATIHMTISWSLSFRIIYEPHSKNWIGTTDLDSLEVMNTMDPLQSWVLPGKERPEILNHEQRHFDLNEVYRRKLRQALFSPVVQGESADVTYQLFQEAVQRIANQLLNSLENLQKRYDSETAHGNNLKRQREWDTAIAAWLADPARAP